MKNKSMEGSGFNEMLAFFIPFAQLSAAGIQNKMEPKEVVDYFIKFMKEFTLRVHEIEDVTNI